MGDSIGVTAVVIAVLIIGAAGLSQESFAITQEEINEKLKVDDVTKRPTFGLTHDNNKKIVDKGFSFNNKTFTITDNFHTPFAEHEVTIGEANLFSAKVYSENGLKVQEFLFGIPQKGDAHLSELGIEVWFGLFGEIEDIKIIQNSNIIDAESVTTTHEKTKCSSGDKQEKCDMTTVSVIFLEPLKDKVMAIKAIDFKNRYQITYLNEGFDISGDTLNPLPTALIPSNVKNEGLIQVTQTEKYSNLWASDDGRIFERNDFGSFNQIDIKFERFHDSGNAFSRLHSEFGKILEYEQGRAKKVFDSSKVISEIPESSSLLIKPSQRMDENMKQLMLEQEKISQEYLKESTKQARF